MDEQKIRKRLLQEGFTIINRYDDPPNEFFPDHTHPGDQLLVVLSGSMEVVMNGETKTLKAGDELFFPAGVVHNARMGSEGCVYLDGERPPQT